ncbi:hypothetical protein BpHYR1_021225 [Brachionus plicatilis]|uniref:Uncharacterized protein n=1 Tax=Brachionus plicatilis TaxID=10195 RepID=A0A3M7T378_BRAPC|nr:hypothetical protein BpHYR1_021225 [Brachionus plicatilis]
MGPVYGSICNYFNFKNINEYNLLEIFRLISYKLQRLFEAPKLLLNGRTLFFVQLLSSLKFLFQGFNRLLQTQDEAERNSYKAFTDSYFDVHCVIIENIIS